MTLPSHTTAEIRQVRGPQSIRTRLLLAFILLVSVPAALIGILLVISTSQGSRLQVINQLETVSSSKESSLLNWIEDLKRDLEYPLIDPEVRQAAVNLTIFQPGSQEFQTSHDEFRSRLIRTMTSSRLFEDLFLITGDGKIAASTHPADEGMDVSSERYFNRALTGAYTSPPRYDPEIQRMRMAVASPVTDEEGQVIGVLAGWANMEQFSRILQNRIGLGETGESYLVGTDYSIMGTTRHDDAGAVSRTRGAIQALGNFQSGSGVYENFRGVPVVGVYRYVPELQSALLTEQELIESKRATYAVLAVNLSIALASLLIAVLAALSITHTIAEPVSDLVETVSRFAAGEYDLQVSVESEDEIGLLGAAFNQMTTQIRTLIGNLENLVAERTQALTKRTDYLQAASEVGRATSSILDVNRLIRQAVELIQKHFDLYYVGLFIVDDARKWVVLRAGTGEAGQMMLSRGHQLKIGGTSMVGWAVAYNQSRIAQVATEDEVRSMTPELPETRSEAAIPMRSRGQVIGALTVQSQRPKAFDDASIAVLQTMADQLAVALDNARLLYESQAALEAERRAYGELGQIAWDQWFTHKSALSLRSSTSGVHRIEPVWRPEMEEAFRKGATVVGPANGAESEGSFDGKVSRLAVPLQLRGAIIGVLSTHRGENQDWSQEEVEMIETITTQLAAALDSARLYAETQKQAEQERLVSEITSRIRETLEVETVLKTAATEIYEALGLDEMTVWISPEFEKETGGTGTTGRLPRLKETGQLLR